MFHGDPLGCPSKEMNMTPRSLHSIRSVPVGLNRPTIVTRDVTSDLLGDGMNPFIVASLFDMTGPTFPPHPHAGFTVMTYILPESGTAFLNQDSTGFSNRIAQGGLHATIAGQGVLHEETNETAGISALGFQIWLNMTAEARATAPRPLTLDAGNVPVIRREGMTLRLLAGASNGAMSPLALPTPIRLMDVTLAPGARFTQDLKETEQVFLWFMSGSATVAAADGRAETVGPLMAARFNTDGDGIAVEAGPEGARFMVFAGEPIHEPLVLGGPFVGSSRAEIETYQANFRAGRMGMLVPFAQKIAA
jgi:redox-sensitive bicupin YhaK (pirin superfamily)